MKKLSLLVLLLFSASIFIYGQVSTPPQGENQKSIVTQYMGLVEIKVEYNSPNVTGPQGQDRKEKMFGEYIRYGMTKERWMEVPGEPTQPKPYRLGANENTTISISHEVQVQGNSLQAGKYGLFAIPGEEIWTIIFSNKSDSWGHYFYREEDDALRISVQPQSIAHQEWLDFSFTDRFLDSTTLVFSFDNVALPIHFKVENINQLYLNNIKSELDLDKLHHWYNFMEAAEFCLNNEIDLAQGLIWADKAISQSWVGQANFQTIALKADILRKMERIEEADSIMDFAINYCAGVFDLHNYARRLVHENQIDKAIEMFKSNFHRYPNLWVTNLGMARGLSLTGDFETALEYALKAQELIPEHELPLRKRSLRKVVESLKRKETPKNYFFSTPNMSQEY